MIVDSDTTIGPDCIRELAACLGDPRLGAVGAPAIVRNPNDNALTTFQVFIYYLGFQLYKQPECAVRQVGVIGGYAFMLRRAIML
jgi:cellulose synthase/poly-beta-1,6-N-acetylglucosamine synthase-like glycosyltransferase